MFEPVSVPQMRYRQFLPLNDPRIGDAGMWSDKTDTYLLKLCGAVVDAFQVYEIAAWFTRDGRLVPPSPGWRGVFGTVNDCAEREFEMVFCQGIYGGGGGLGIYEAIGEDVRRARLTAEDQWPLLIAAAIAVADDPVFQNQKDRLPRLLKKLTVWTDEPVWTTRPINQDHNRMATQEGGIDLMRWRYGKEPAAAAAAPEPVPHPASTPPPPETPKRAPAAPVVEPVRTLH
jgi:hypothetical protein